MTLESDDWPDVNFRAEEQLQMWDTEMPTNTDLIVNSETNSNCT